MTLFCEGTCGKCANKGCLDEMNAAFLTEKAIETIKAYTALSLSHDAYCYNADAVNRLKEMGYEVVALQCRYKDYRHYHFPKSLKPENMRRKTKYKEAKIEYEQDMNDYMEEGKELVRRQRSRRNIALRTDWERRHCQMLCGEFHDECRQWTTGRTGTAFPD